MERGERTGRWVEESGKQWFSRGSRGRSSRSAGQHTFRSFIGTGHWGLDTLVYQDVRSQVDPRPRYTEEVDGVGKTGDMVEAVRTQWLFWVSLYRLRRC